MAAVEFAWKDIQITAMGRVFNRVLGIEYMAEATKKQIYGRGKKVLGIQNGNETPRGSITLGQSEVEAMIRAAQATNPLAKLTDIEMDIQVHYLNGISLVKDKIVGAQFTSIPKNMNQGDPDMEIKLDFVCTDILYNDKG